MAARNKTYNLRDNPTWQKQRKQMLAISSVRVQFPKLRLGQFLHNVQGGVDWYYKSDEEVVKMFTDYLWHFEGGNNHGR